jgi:iron complex outermembrane receptor protein
MVNEIRAVFLAALAIAACPSVVLAQAAPPDLARATLEELMDMRVTTAARKSQRVEDVPAAIHVITRSDIRRSGLMTLPEILRLAPGVEVAQSSASKWAVSIRGFNNTFANKLLVLIDGRSLYSRTFSGVIWDTHDLIVSDIDRIEVIRGPGGVAWGANAVNGVINVITRPATETQGLALDVSAGTFDRGRVGVRYGGKVGATSYRVFSQWSEYADSRTGEFAQFSDKWRSLTGGVRADWSRGTDAVVTQAHFTTNQTRPGWLELPSLVPGMAYITDGVSRANEVSLVARWTRTWTSGKQLQLQAYHTTMRRDEPIFPLAEYTSDIDAQYETRLGARHGLVAGGGYRHVDIAAGEDVTVQMPAARIETFNAFLQDEISLRRGLLLTVGSKLEYDSLGGWGALPSARIIWEASPTQRLWAAASRTRRTPAVSDRDIQINLSVQPGPGLPIVIAVRGNPDFRSERFVQLEAGHRIRLGPTAALDTTVFTGAYDGLRTSEPFVPALQLTPAPMHLLAGVYPANLLSARASGFEISARWNPVAPWQIQSSYSALFISADLDPISMDATIGDTDGSAPQHQWQASTSISLRPGVEIGASVSRVGSLRGLGVPAYTRADARAQFRLNRHLTAALVVQNMTSRHHVEFASPSLFLTTSVPRSARLDLRWEF